MTAFLSLGAHDLAIAHLGIAYPDTSLVPPWAKLLGLVVRIASSVYLCHLAGWFLNKRSPAASAAIVGLAIVFLGETLRAIIVGNVLVEGWVDRRWIYMVTSLLPEALSAFYQGAVAVMIARLMRHQRLAAVVLAVLAASIFGYLAVLPGFRLAAAAIEAAFDLTQPPELYQMPYGLHIYQFIYGTFMEPTLAAFFLVYLLWPALSGSDVRRIMIFATILLLIRGRVSGTFFYVFWLKLPWPMALAAEGQFFVETLVLAVLTGLTWAYLSRQRAAR